MVEDVRPRIELFKDIVIQEPSLAAVLWCSLLETRKAHFRTGVLKPDYIRINEAAVIEHKFSLKDFISEMQGTMIKSVVDHRRQMLQRLPQLPEFISPKGKLLTYNPGANFEDGNAKGASNGFFDAYDTPPWDTWVEHRDLRGDHRMFLISWIPEDLVETANDGIDVSHGHSLEWLENINPSVDSRMMQLLTSADRLI